MTTIQTCRADVPGTSPPQPNGSPRWFAGVRRWVRRGGVPTLLFALPMVLGFAYFRRWPIINGVILTFQETNLITTRWVGLDNIVRILNDPLLGQAALNTGYYAALGILFGFPVPLLAAATISEMRRGQRFASIVAFLPVVIPPVVSILLWKRFYLPGPDGLINTIVGWFGVEPVGWLQEPATGMPALVLAATWAGAGSTVIIYLAAMTTIDRQAYDAAEVDGTSVWQRIWHVMLPRLRGRSSSSCFFR